MSRIYKPWREKHKWPKGFGSWCPRMPEGRAQSILEDAIADPEGGSKLYGYDRGWCFVAQPTRADEYHGYPVPGAEIPEQVFRAFIEAGKITSAQRRRLRKQAALPSGYDEQ